MYIHTYIYIYICTYVDIRRLKEGELPRPLQEGCVVGLHLMVVCAQGLQNLVGPQVWALSFHKRDHVPLFCEWLIMVL